jgi:hypothetical protein
MRGKECASVGGVARAEDNGEINHEGGRVKGRRGRQNQPRNIEFAGAGRRMPKRVGEIFEAAFVTKAGKLGLWGR